MKLEHQNLDIDLHWSIECHAG